MNSDKLEEEMSKNNYNFFDKHFPGGLFGYRVSHMLLHPFLILYNIYLRMKWAVQRVYRGWDDRVIWSIDYYLADKIPEWIAALIDSKPGIPSVMFNRDDFNEDYSLKDGKEKLKAYEYEKILYEIIEGFKSYKIMQEYFDDPIIKQILEEKFSLGMKRFVEYFNTLGN